MIFESDLPEEIFQREPGSGGVARTLVEITESAERAGIAQALAANDHHRELTAKSLGISIRTLHYKMNKYDLH
jgi:two-component system NtrC family response regulator